LNVFPITLPPLRERQEDIPQLAKHFVRKFAERQGKVIDYVPGGVMESLKRHRWPGNIRELQNFIERAVIMSSGPHLHLPPGELNRTTRSDTPTSIRTLAEAERDHILHVLRQVHGVVGGRNGAAARLGLARTTLVYRMRKLGITQERTIAVERAASQWDAPGAHARLTNSSVRNSMEPAWLS
jgi:formate hydrogenlyase transcriptional activator